MPLVCFSSWCASFTTALPFSSSSPMFSRPTVGLLRPSTPRASTEPRCAKPTSSRASQSTLAPPSTTSTGSPALGNSAGEPVLVVDGGANVDCDARELVGFAHLGSVDARGVLGRNNPTVGLLNIGEEEEKGNA